MLRSYAAHFDTPAGYLDFARFGPPSRDALAATTGAMEDSARADHTTVDVLMRAEGVARETAGRLAGTDTRHTVLLPNASTGLFHAALGIREGVVLAPSTDFPSNQYPWRRTADLGRAVPRWLTPATGGGVTPDLVRAALTDDVVALSVSAVDFRTGFRADLAALREAIGPDRLLIVDAIQAFGVAELPWDAADVVVAGGQKWLRAGWATGFAALSDRALETLDPVLTGWTGVEDVGLFDGTEHPPAPDAQRWSITNLSPVTAAALAAALGLVERHTVAAIEAAISSRIDELTEVVGEYGGRVLSPTDPARRAGILSFTMPDHAPAVVAKALHAEGVTPTVRADSLRLSPHASTPPEVSTRVAAALSSLRA
ncbi:MULTISPECIES: aminotransferase class V-fold PLP-dependent enzyme [unclassified Streptomyces]|uniref:aminotransferase class V-fold PLP-dependent enzyme n=1 Tax=unclassified Streptomyces TaxID=2593676 RepID=UPI0011CD4E7C|nr:MULTISPECIES: aminotransferase class V-fold PLP-dependent enzyme [unclassified Streptomyces]TXS69666.1 aminotransferase class V-fold PLP-dependent enzyme [Streptomyces sp. me109]